MNTTEKLGENRKNKRKIKSVCKIPAHLLNTGQHSVRILLVRNGRNVISVIDDALTFEVVETDQRTGAWFGKVAGVVRPKLEWKNEYIDDI